MQPRPDRPDVFCGGDLVGAVHDSVPLAAIPLQVGRQVTPEVRAFFENLLPEGELRDFLAAQRKASTIFSLLLEVADNKNDGRASPGVSTGFVRMARR